MTATRSVLRFAALSAQLLLATATWAETPPVRHAEIDTELLLDLLGWASRLSGLTLPPGGLPVDALPSRQPLAVVELAVRVCPNATAPCRGLVAAYNTERRRILYRDTLDMRDPSDQSFIVHEPVHFLQHRTHGGDLEVSCEAVLASERQACDVQNACLAHFRQWQRTGDVLRFIHRPGAAAPAPVLNFRASTLPRPRSPPRTHPDSLHNGAGPRPLARP